MGRPLPRLDPRAQHLLAVLQRAEGDAFDAGVVDEGLGKARVREITADAVNFDYTPGPAMARRPEVHLLVGLTRPQTARDILRDGTTLGVTALTFVFSERADPNYAASTLWSSGEWRRHVLAGAAQAFDPRLPEVRWGVPLAEAAKLSAAGEQRLALDLYEAAGPLADVTVAASQPLVLAVGPERGWASADRQLLREQGFQLVRLTLPVLRVETAVVAALSVLSARRAPA